MYKFPRFMFQEVEMWWYFELFTISVRFSKAPVLLNLKLVAT
jgi:hypothetical protein